MRATEIDPTAIAFQVTFDAHEPHAVAAFWAEVLGYEVEDSSALVEQLVSSGQLPASEVVQVDGRAAFRVGAGITDPTGQRPRLLFQVVPEDKEAKNRVHLDLRVADAERPAEIERLEGLGARRIGEGNQGPHAWVVMADPEGNEFCVA